MTFFIGGLLFGLIFWYGERMHRKEIEKMLKRNYKDDVYWLEEYLKLKDEFESEGEQWKEK